MATQTWELSSTGTLEQEWSSLAARFGEGKERHQRETTPVRNFGPLCSTQHHRDHIPEAEIQKEVRQIEKELDELELQGVDMEKQLRGCEGGKQETALRRNRPRRQRRVTQSAIVVCGILWLVI